MGDTKGKQTKSTTFLNLKKCDEVLVSAIYNDCVLVKHMNVFGWILREQLGE